MAVVVMQDCRLTDTDVEGEPGTGLSCGTAAGADELRFLLWQWRVEGTAPDGVGAAEVASWRASLRNCFQDKSTPAHRLDTFVVCEGFKSLTSNSYQVLNAN
ncbi:hypothetical protein GPECTOR_4g631 [Gonium pectorale]|uniref:Uncharacterized protein n=1 Tax=Gonium pectorale TaxID=33097 RepID=A0A150GXC6_GONPE|nr:hypothetical protein GPECTOR_4g631 [Gonium pectorale]|eukprot:KXZ54566.1 hypothetical protein GPECTOR_4g631 [Gonium pectorale]